MITTEVITTPRTQYEQFTRESSSLAERIYRTHLDDAVSFAVLAAYKPTLPAQQDRLRRDGGSRANWAQRARRAYSSNPKGW